MRPLTLSEAVHAAAMRQRDAALAEVERLRRLLREAREWLNGCRGAAAPTEDEPCECEDCEASTDLLDRIDLALGDRQ